MKLLFVYNADSGLTNALMDWGHKLVSPETYACQLCKLTYGWAGMKTEWRAFVDALPHEVVFLDRDEFKQLFDWNVETPAVLTTEPLSVFLDAPTLNAVLTLKELIQLVEARLDLAQT